MNQFNFSSPNIVQNTSPNVRNISPNVRNIEPNVRNIEPNMRVSQNDRVFLEEEKKKIA